jgi:hypothetical protein
MGECLGKQKELWCKAKVWTSQCIGKKKLSYHERPSMDECALVKKMSYHERPSTETSECLCKGKKKCYCRKPSMDELMMQW